eukprot:1154430-Pelagomonas_calceolata.AAC.3
MRHNCNYVRRYRKERSFGPNYSLGASLVTGVNGAPNIKAASFCLDFMQIMESNQIQRRADLTGALFKELKPSGQAKAG